MIKGAFTLIELLIVVAIVGILAAIAILNFRNAHVRAQVVQSQFDLKNLDISIKQLMIDKNVMLVDLDDRKYSWAKKRIDNVFHGIGHERLSFPDFNIIMSPLTSPTPYLNQLPDDPFITKLQNTDDEFNFYSHDTYIYIDNDPAEIKNNDFSSMKYYKKSDPVFHDPIILNESEYLLHGMGPGYTRVFDGENEVYLFHNIPYQPTNGVYSFGIMMLHSGEGLIQ